MRGMIHLLLYMEGLAWVLTWRPWRRVGTERCRSTCLSESSRTFMDFKFAIEGLDPHAYVLPPAFGP